MDKRQFLLSGAVSAVAPTAVAAAASTARTGPGLLTVAGAITRSNRGAIDPALDQLLLKHGRTFDKAWEFDSAMLARRDLVSASLERPGRTDSPVRPFRTGQCSRASAMPNE